MKPLDYLNKLEWEAKKAKYPDMPEHILTSKRHKDKTANQLTKAIIRYIQLTGGQAERISVTGRRLDQRKTYTDAVGRTKQIGSVSWAKSSMQKGSADVSAVIKGKSVKIEVKIGSDTQKPEQKEYQSQVEKAGGIYIIARSFEGFLNELENYKLN